jgi:hypothetical protein
MTHEEEEEDCENQDLLGSRSDDEHYQLDAVVGLDGEEEDCYFEKPEDYFAFNKRKEENRREEQISSGKKENESNN